jgi:hypothetical protein
MWVYRRMYLTQADADTPRYQVGFYDPGGKWEYLEPDFDLESDAQYLVHYLNGGNEE